MTSDVDDRTKAAESKVFLVYALTSVAVVMSPSLIRDGFSNIVYHIVTENGK